uniref:DNA primase n=1 Tax=Pithovirus LCPAC401 TaxID=2506595 RepID=A0A481ZAE3_9VIRU|nr:MAG: DNA primase [Pithovirus LCPAC401]
MSYRIINDKRWYYKLYNGLFTTSPFITSGIVISLEDSNVHRLFALFDDHIELFKYIIAFEPERRCFYEVITQNQKHKYDIDIKGQSYEFANAILDDLLRSIDKVYKDVFNVDLKDNILVYQSHGTNKFSYHVIIDGYCLSTSKECEKIYQLTIKLMESQYAEYIDSSVYKSTQQMRLLWSHKAKSDRTKHLMTKFKFRGETQDVSKRVNRKEKQEEHLTLLTMFTESLVSVTHSCILISMDIEKQEKVLYDTVEHDSDLIYSIFVKSLKDKNPFKLLSEKGSLVLLKRMFPSYCNVCSRVHENENPYLVISGGVIYFDCRRSDGERQTVGYLESIDKSIANKEECIPTSEPISIWYRSIINKISENDTVNEYGSVQRCFKKRTTQSLSRFDSLMLCGNEFSS